MSIVQQLRGFWRAFRSDDGSDQIGPSTSLARTLRDSTHVRGGRAGGIPVAGTEAQHKIVADGHERYTASFDDDA